jgi:hypothetical protein
MRRSAREPLKGLYEIAPNMRLRFSIHDGLTLSSRLKLDPLT